MMMNHAANGRVHQNKLFYKTQESINRKLLIKTIVCLKIGKDRYISIYQKVEYPNIDS